MANISSPNKKMNIASSVAQLLNPTVEELGCTLWDVEYQHESGGYVLRITIDKPDGIDITDCEAVHRAIDPILDEADPIPQAYTLEVSSPGIERILRTPAHLDYAIGKTVSVKLFTPINGKKQHVCKLDSYNADTDTLALTTADGIDSFTVTRQAVSRICIYFDFNDN